MGSRSAGRTVDTPFGDITVQPFSVDLARQCHVVLMAAGGDFAKEHAAAIAAGHDGAVVIDNSSALRMDPTVPLVVPEINMDSVKDSKLIANPNCTTAIAAVALWPLHQRFKIKKIIISSYQAASGAGAAGMAELQTGTQAAVSGQDVSHSVFAHQLPFNLIPHIDVFQPNGYTKEEMKINWETKKIFNDPDIAVSCTAVRVPTLRAHAEAITIETELPINVEAATTALAAAPGVCVVDNPSELEYPMPLSATGCDDVEVGRLRQSLVFGDKGLDMFVCGDQLLRGAALNAVLIWEHMSK